MYQEEQRLGTIVRYASVLSIFIACMGLFGLATLVVARRTKEIGIRKVLGADIKGLGRIVFKRFYGIGHHRITGIISHCLVGIE